MKEGVEENLTSAQWKEKDEGGKERIKHSQKFADLICEQSLTFIE